MGMLNIAEALGAVRAAVYRLRRSETLAPLGRPRGAPSFQAAFVASTTTGGSGMDSFQISYTGIKGRVVDIPSRRAALRVNTNHEL